jgi:hypothetical protein
MSKDMLENLWFDEFLSNVNDIAEALDVTLCYHRPTEEDAENVRALHQIIRTGKLSIPAESIALTLTRSQLEAAVAGLEAGNGLHFPRETQPDFAVVFGRPLNLGPYGVFLCVRELAIEENALEEDAISVKLRLASPILYRFMKFLPTGGSA